MSNTVHTNGPFSTRVRRFAGPVVLAGAISAGAFAAPAAIASPISSVRAHVHAADLALHAVAKAKIGGDLSVPLTALTNQLGAAANITVKLAVTAHTPSVEQLAGAALGLVANEETKAEQLLTSVTSTVSAGQQVAVATADQTIADARSAGLKVLAKLTMSAQVNAHAVARLLTKQLATLTAAGKGLLISLSDAVQNISGSVVSAIPSVISSLATTVTADVHADLGNVSGVVSTVGGTVPATISTLQNLTAQILGGGSVPADSGCPTGGCTGTTTDTTNDGGLLNINAGVSVNAVLTGLLGL